MAVTSDRGGNTQDDIVWPCRRLQENQRKRLIHNITEVEKALAGQGDENGVAKRMFGKFLTWLADHESDVFTICSANDISALPPEFARQERFDALFFMDLPQREQKDKIWEIYLQRWDLAVEEIDDTDWTGAEIRACCRLATLLGRPLKDVSRQIVPVAHTAMEKVELLRAWAESRCLDAESGKAFKIDKSSAARGASGKRLVTRNS